MLIGRAKKFEIVTSIHVQFDENVPTHASQYYQKTEAMLETLKVAQELEHVSDFEYLVGLRFIDDDMLYEVTRVLIGQENYILGDYALVLPDNTLSRPNKIKMHVKDIEVALVQNSNS